MFDMHSFKWVENPQHGKGGSDWVEVCTAYTLRSIATEDACRTTLKP